MALNFKEVQRLTSPNPFALVSTRKPDETTNLMALSWWTYVSNKPPTIAICISQKNFSYELIKANKEFGLNIVGESLRESAFLCGSCSGRNENKPEKFGIGLIDSTVIRTKLVQNYRIAMECQLKSSIDSEDHIICIAEVVAFHTNAQRNHLYSFDGYNRLGTVTSSYSHGGNI